MTDLQRRMPAEWEPHEAVWLAWPHDADEWGPFFEAARHSVAELIRTLRARADNDAVQLLVDPRVGNDAILDGVRELVTVHRVPYWDIWLRDTGPLYTVGEQGFLAADFAFNGWGGKYNYPEDAEVARSIAHITKTTVQGYDLVLEGGAIDVNGAGWMLATRHSILNDNRNPGLSEAQVEAALARALGTTRVIWLDRGLLNDHTDSHVDNIARFATKSSVLCMQARSAQDPNRAVLEDIHSALAKSGLEVIELPSPGLVVDASGTPMPASYCNFYIANRQVIVPVYDTEYDREALDILTRVFPDREVVGLSGRALLSGGGAFHCITQQQPRSHGIRSSNPESV